MVSSPPFQPMQLLSFIRHKANLHFVDLCISNILYIDGQYVHNNSRNPAIFRNWHWNSTTFLLQKHNLFQRLYDVNKDSNMSKLAYVLLCFICFYLLHHANLLSQLLNSIPIHTHYGYIISQHSKLYMHERLILNISNTIWFRYH